MRFKIKLMKVVVMGLGLHGGGVGVVKWLARQNFSKILVTDLKTRKELASSLKKLRNLGGRVKYILGRHRIKDFSRHSGIPTSLSKNINEASGKNPDLIIKNPGVPKESPYLKIARKNNIPIETDISLFFRFWPGKIIGVTGTRGKSTTATLIFQILKTAGLPAYLAGNIGHSVLKLPISGSSTSRYVAVLELSSWQLEDAAHIGRSPETAVITNIYPEHLNRYKNLKEYIKAKKNIFKFQKAGDYLLLNRDNKISRAFARESRARVKWFGGDFLEADFNAARRAAEVLKIPKAIVEKTLKDFLGLEHRLEHFHNWRGVRFYNDSAATSPEATIAALKKFNKKVILIAGGVDKNLDYKELSRQIKKRASHLILLPGSASEKIGQNLHLETESPSSLFGAVKLVKQIARPGDVVLFSPAAASFNLFKNEFDRGRKFKKYVRRIFKKS